MSDYEIRAVTTDDAGRLLKIYSYYVENTAITFEYDPPTLEEFTVPSTPGPSTSGLRR